MSTPTETDETLYQGSLRNHFLIAMPNLADPNFSNSLIYICEHSRDGSMGLIINRPMDVPLSRVFEQLEVDGDSLIGTQPLLSGGPVSTERGFVLHATNEKRWESTMKISPQVSLTASRDILIDIAAGNGPQDAMVVLGYAGWGAGQLEEEIADNAWLTVPADAEIIFHTPFAKRTQAAAATLGIDLIHLSGGAGHA
ncbi:YqgE/AlgH family protein [Porticoccaceae bacterium LTM1]|nr:YqgE/AlgH family protein [Porticoccaceae bacterium LTM1]